MDEFIGFLGFCAVSSLIIDYIIAKNNQRFVKSTLVEVWTNLNLLKIKNFGPSEANYTINLIEYLFGANFFSLKRFFSTICVGFLCIILGVLMPEFTMIVSRHISYFSNQFGITYAIGYFGISLFYFHTSISITLFLLRKSIQLMDSKKIFQIIAFPTFLAIQYICVFTFSRFLDYCFSVGNLLFFLFCSYLKFGHFHEFYKSAASVFRHMKVKYFFSYFKFHLSDISLSKIFYSLINTIIYGCNTPDNPSVSLNGAGFLISQFAVILRILIALVFTFSFILSLLRDYFSDYIEDNAAKKIPPLFSIIFIPLYTICHYLYTNGHWLKVFVLGE